MRRINPVFAAAAVVASIMIAAAAPTPGRGAGDLPLLGRWDFEGDAGASGWAPHPAASWRVSASENGAIYVLAAPGTPGRFRAPTAWSLLDGFDLGAFDLSGRFRSTSDPANPLADVCVVFRFRDPEHFSYVHFSGRSDGAHNIIARVDGADRVKVNREPAGGSEARLTDRAWHAFRVAFDPAAGEVRAFIDDLSRPVLTAPAAAAHGCVGVGSFDDTGEFDDIVLRGTAPERPAPNALTPEEAAEGWTLLFDGRTLAGWRGIGRPDVPPGHWAVRDGVVEKIPTRDVPLQADGQPLAGGDLMTERTFRDFELAFEWSISPGGNSGVKYNVSEAMSAAHTPSTAALGFEYQVLDDAVHPDAANGPNRTAAALYDLVEPGPAKALRPPGAWNDARIVFRGGRGEHWLNGARVLAFDVASPDFAARLARSKYRDFAGFAEVRAGHIVLQDHTDAARFRSIRVREFAAPKDR